VFGEEKGNRDLIARRYGPTTSCTTCARSVSDGANAPQRAPPLEPAKRRRYHRAHRAF